MNCHHCAKPATFTLDGGLPLCIDCCLKVTQIAEMRMNQSARLLNYVSEQMDATFGMPGASPKIPITKVTPMGDVTLHNIHVTGGTVGVINTGSVQTLDSAVTVLRSHHEMDAATALAKVTEGVLSSSVSEEEKNRILELLSVISTEASAPSEKRRRTAMRPLLAEVTSAMGTVADLTALWTTFGPAIIALFQ